MLWSNHGYDRCSVMVEKIAAAAKNILIVVLTCSGRHIEVNE